MASAHCCIPWKGWWLVVRGDEADALKIQWCNKSTNVEVRLQSERPQRTRQASTTSMVAIAQHG
jgi:hypothetical protein